MSVALKAEAPLDAYRGESPLIDVGHPAVQDCAKTLAGQGASECEIVQALYEFVRDQVAHSWDIQSRRVTARASDVLRHREGICYAKSHLLAALLRTVNIPCGLCYQKLTLGDTPETGYCLHALNAVYLSDTQRWIRLDARGNKPGIDAQFSLTEERLAFSIREQMGERDYAEIYAEPPAPIVQALMTHSDCRLMYQNGLPTDL
ncbi:MAG: transglutaminase family protein [Armatimonadota bacterium]|nr:transglutaminase family protein [Armatimonadota bacterium]